MEELIQLMRRLRDPEDGCPWDLEQDFASIAPCTIEEAYEVADAVERNDLDGLRDELGDLLLQVVFHAQIAAEQDAFDFEDVARGIHDKLVRRHPHIFGSADIDTAEDQLRAWDKTKSDERQARGVDSLMDEIPRGMPELERSLKIQKRAGEAGFEWPAAEPVLDKLSEEVAELKEAMAAGNPAAIEDELGDLLFVLVNLARQLGHNPGAALRHANAKFERRFRDMERRAGGSTALAALDLDAMEAIWQAVKQTEATPGGAPPA